MLIFVQLLRAKLQKLKKWIFLLIQEICISSMLKHVNQLLKKWNLGYK